MNSETLETPPIADAELKRLLVFMTQKCNDREIISNKEAAALYTYIDKIPSNESKKPIESKINILELDCRRYYELTEIPVIPGRFTIDRSLYDLILDSHHL